MIHIFFHQGRIDRIKAKLEDKIEAKSKDLKGKKYIFFCFCACNNFRVEGGSSVDLNLQNCVADPEGNQLWIRILIWFLILICCRDP